MPLPSFSSLLLLLSSSPFPSLLPPLLLVDCCFFLPLQSPLPLPSCRPRPSCRRCRRAAVATAAAVLPPSCCRQAATAVAKLPATAELPLSNRRSESRGGIHKKISGLEKKAKKVPRVFFQNWCSGTKTKGRSGCRRSPLLPPSPPLLARRKSTPLASIACH